MAEFKIPTPEQIAVYRGDIPSTSVNYLSRFQAYDANNLDSASWEAMVIRDSVTTLRPVLARMNGAGHSLVSSGMEERGADIFSLMYELEQPLARSTERGVPVSYFGSKLNFYHEAANYIKQRRRFNEFTTMQRSIDTFRDNLRAELRGMPGADARVWGLPTAILQIGLTTLYLMCCEPNRFLVGTKNGLHWKKIKLGIDSINPDPPLHYYGLKYLNNLPVVGQRELPVVPEAMIHINNMDKVTLPKPARSVEDLLEDTFFHRRYNVPPEGADVRFMKAGDIAKMSVLQSDGFVMGRVMTVYGDKLVRIDLETGTYDDFTAGITEDPNQAVWGNIVAETYHDLVTADVISTTHHRPLRSSMLSVLPDISSDISFSDSPQVIYIPRTVRTRLQTEEPREIYHGMRHVKPHFVTDYLRRGNMSDKQKQELLKLEQQWGIQFIKNVPEGHTWVRPHVTPKGAERFIKSLPIFVKRRIETQLAAKLHARKEK